jgi:hypothetical protein
MLSPTKDQSWTLKQCKKYSTRSHIARLWYCHDMDAIRGWLARWEFCMIAYAIQQFVLQYGVVNGGPGSSKCTYSNLTMVYVEVMLESM